jgi:ketosteroid isomerase-like protein
MGADASELSIRGVMSEEDNVKFVRRLWAAIGEGGLEAALELTEPQVEWRPHPAGGRVFTSQELLQFYQDFQGERYLLEARPYSFHAHGDRVLASGSFRLRGRDQMAEFQIHFVYEFEDGTLLRAATYARRGEALQAIGLEELPE